MTAPAGLAVVSGMICGHPNQGGATWAVLQYLLGLRRLGWRVHFVERVSSPAPAQVRYLDRTMSAFGLGGCWTLLGPSGDAAAGAPRPVLEQICRHADLLLNISGCLADPELTAGPALRVYLDLDPAFTQLWHAQGIDMGFDRHDRFVTVGLGIGGPECAIPTCGRRWLTTLPPVVLEHWPAAVDAPRPELTTVGHWRGYGSIEHEGVVYGQRAHSMRKLLGLARSTDQPFLLALAIHPEEHADVEALAAQEWCIVDPASVAGDPAAYRDFVASSRGELGVPKSGYIASQSGWFSDRSACYLASGRPVVTWDTGFARFVPTGRGLLSFDGCAEAVEQVAAMNSDYVTHARAAREFAEAYLDSDRLLGRLLDQVAAAA